MRATHRDPKRTSGDKLEAKPTTHREQEPRPAVKVSLVPYATDEVQWYDLDEFPLAY